MNSSLCIICGDKSPINSKRGRKRKKESVCEGKLELMLGYLLDNETNKFVNLKTNILKLKEGKTVGFCAKCELEAEAILELHLELEKVQMQMIDKLEGVKKLILKLDLDEERSTEEDSLGALKDFQDAVKDNGKGSVRIPLVFLERHSFIRKENTTYILLENQVKTEPDPVSNWDSPPTPDFDSGDDSTDERNIANAFDATEVKLSCNEAEEMQPANVKRGRGRPHGNFAKSDSALTHDLDDFSPAAELKPTCNSTEAIQPSNIKRGRGRPSMLRSRKGKPKDPHRILKCDTCPYQTSSRRPSRFEEHLRSHETVDRPLNCEICDERFSTKQYFNFHLSLHKKKIKCEVCSEKYNVLEAQAHLKTHVDVVFPCSKCHKCYISITDYFRHLQDNHEGQGLKCHLCILPMQSLKPLLELMEHLHQVHNLGEELKCDFEGCAKTFVHSKALAKHKIIHTDLFTCRICQKRSSSLANLRLHEMNHSRSGLKEFKCDQCLAEYMSQEGLDGHIKAAHEGQKFQCEKCGKEYNLKAGLKSHMITAHGAVSKWICQICGEKFGRTQMLKRHLESKHSTEKKYVCEECGKAFQVKRNYITHKKIHGEKTFKCSYCPSAFTKRKYLIDHERTHTGAKPFVCSLCGMAYRHWSSLSFHRRKCGKATS